MSVGKARQGYKLVKLSNLSQTKETSIPDDWLVKRIEEIGEKDPETIDESKYEYSEIEYIDIGAIADFKITKTEKISLKDRPSRAQKIVRKDDVIISTVRPYLRSFTTIDNETKNLVCSTGFAVIRAKDSVLSQLIFSNTQSHHFNTQMIRLMQGSNYPAVSSGIVGNVMIPYPPDKKEREKITSILSNVDEQMQQTQKMIDLTQRLKKGLMQELLTRGIGHTKFKKVKWYFGTQIEIPKDWEVRTLGSLVTLLTNGFVGKATVHYTESENSVLYVQGYNIKENNFNFHGIKRVSHEFDEQNKKSRLQSGDLLTIQTGNIGTTAIVPDELIGANCHALIISRLKREIADPEFYSQYFNSYHCQRMFKMIEIGTSLKHLNGSDMKKLQFLRPPLPEQQKIASILSNVDEQINQHKNEKALLERIKKGLMQQLLTGQRRVILQ